MASRGDRLRLVAALVVLLVASSRVAVADPATNGAAADREACYRIGADHLACYDAPRPFGFVLNAPGDIGGLVADGLRRDDLLAVAGIAIATAGLLIFDEDLAAGAHRVGRWAHISEGKTKSLPVVPIPYPTDAGSALYYIGDGMLPVALTVGILGYGLATSDRRALQTASQLTEGLVSVAVVAQTLKHLTGRESPSRATESGGRWKPFPDPSAYMKDVPAFDAFPSGHLATAMVTVTVLAENYPEYWLIRPAGYGLMTLLGFQMLNNDVHWASDYPLAIGIGYDLGKRAASHGRKIVAVAEGSGGVATRARSPEWKVLPLPMRDGGGLLVSGSF